MEQHRKPEEPLVINLRELRKKQQQQNFEKNVWGTEEPYNEQAEIDLLEKFGLPNNPNNIGGKRSSKRRNRKTRKTRRNRRIRRK